jgi:hypothetical protein
MIDTTDMSQIHASAVKFIERFGDAAPHEAGIRASELRQIGDLQGFARWQLIERDTKAVLKNITISDHDHNQTEISN